MVTVRRSASACSCAHLRRSARYRRSEVTVPVRRVPVVAAETQPSKKSSFTSGPGWPRRPSGVLVKRPEKPGPHAHRLRDGRCCPGASCRPAAGGSQAGRRRLRRPSWLRQPQAESPSKAKIPNTSPCTSPCSFHAQARAHCCRHRSAGPLPRHHAGRVGRGCQARRGQDGGNAQASSERAHRSSPGFRLTGLAAAIIAGSPRRGENAAVEALLQTGVSGRRSGGRYTARLPVPESPMLSADTPRPHRIVAGSTPHRTVREGHAPHRRCGFSASVTCSTSCWKFTSVDVLTDPES